MRRARSREPSVFADEKGPLPDALAHDYTRNGATSLFAARNVLDGTLIIDGQARHRPQEWLEFLRLIKSQAPPDKAVHLICDNYATHKHPKVQAWAQRNPRFVSHFTPTGTSWLSMVERFFRNLSEKAIQRDIFYHVDDLVGAISAYIHAPQPEPQTVHLGGCRQRHPGQGQPGAQGVQ